MIGRAGRALPLVVAALVAALLVQWVAERSAAAIAAAEARARWDALAPALPLAYDNVPIEDTVLVSAPALLGVPEAVAVYRARRAGRVVGVVIPVRAPDGYRGPIRLAVGIDAGGTVLGVGVLAHRETAGLGAQIAHSAWVDGFVGRTLGDLPDAGWRVRAAGGAFDGISGATVTSAAVVRAVHRALRCFAEHRARLLHDVLAPDPVLSDVAPARTDT